MRKDKELKIFVEYSGIEPDLKPLACSIARKMLEEANPDGTFIDPKLEAEYQEWKKSRSY